MSGFWYSGLRSVIFVTLNGNKEMKKIALVNTLAAQIRRNDSSKNRSESMKQAYRILSYENCLTAQVLVFVKISTGTTERRVVCQEWQKIQPPVGGRSTNKPGQILFADLGKFAVGKNCIISTYTQNIVSLA